MNSAGADRLQVCLDLAEIGGVQAIGQLRRQQQRGSAGQCRLLACAGDVKPSSSGLGAAFTHSGQLQP